MSNAAAVLVFGGLALLLFALVYFFFDRGRRPRRARGADADSTTTRAGLLAPVRPFNITFARLFGLLTVAVLGTGLALMATENSQIASSAFTLLGTVAGYLAGAKATVPPAAPPAGADQAPGGGVAAVNPEEHL